MSESPHFPIREPRVSDQPVRRGFEYQSLKAAIAAGAHPLARLNLPENVNSPGAMVRAIQELEHATRREHGG